MVIHAYSDDYLTSAQRILGDMLDFAVNTNVSGFKCVTAI